MVELTLATLLGTVAGDFCELRNQGKPVLESVLLAYSKANDQYGGENVRNVISGSFGLEAQAIGFVVTKCPDKL